MIYYIFWAKKTTKESRRETQKASSLPKWGFTTTVPRVVNLWMIPRRFASSTVSANKAAESCSPAMFCTVFCSYDLISYKQDKTYSFLLLGRPHCLSLYTTKPTNLCSKELREKDWYTMYCRWFECVICTHIEKNVLQQCIHHNWSCCECTAAVCFPCFNFIVFQTFKSWRYRLYVVYITASFLPSRQMWKNHKSPSGLPVLILSCKTRRKH